MTVTPEQFKLIYPEFSEVDDSVVEYYLEIAQTVTSCGAPAVYALTAHYIALRQAETGGGEGGSISTVGTVKKVKVGRVETEYANASSNNPSDAYYESTPYGKMYLSLVDACKKRYVGRVR